MDKAEADKALTPKWYVLLGLLQRYAPNGKAQELCTQLVHKAQENGASDFDLELMLVGYMADGLKYGNWPWNL